MPNYDLSTHHAISDAAKTAHKKATTEPNQSSYNAAWLYGYAEALKDVSQQLEPQHQLIDAVLNYLSEHNDSSSLYRMLHEDMNLTAEEISSLGFDLPQFDEQHFPENLSEPDITSEVRMWHVEAYPTDELGSTIRGGITFSDVVSSLNHNADIYDTLAVHDSVVRERVFGKLSQIMNVDYDIIYNKWLNEANAPAIIAHTEGTTSALSDKIQSAEQRAIQPDPAAKGRTHQVEPDER